MGVEKLEITFNNSRVKPVEFNRGSIIDVDLDVYSKSIKTNGKFEYCEGELTLMGLCYTSPYQEREDNDLRERCKDTVEDDFNKFLRETIRSIEVTYSERDLTKSKEIYYVKEGGSHSITKQGNVAVIVIKKES